MVVVVRLLLVVVAKWGGGEGKGSTGMFPISIYVMYSGICQCCISSRAIAIFIALG